MATSICLEDVGRQAMWPYRIGETLGLRSEEWRLKTRTSLAFSYATEIVISRELALASKREFLMKYEYIVFKIFLSHVYNTLPSTSRLLYILDKFRVFPKG